MREILKLEEKGEGRMPILKTLRKFWTGDTQTRELRLVHRAQLKTISDAVPYSN